MQKIRKHLSILLSLLMIISMFSILPVNAFAGRALISAMPVAASAEEDSYVSDTLTVNDAAKTHNYTAWSGVQKESGAVYAGKSAGDGYYIQFNTGSNQHGGIVSTTSGGLVKSVSVVWNSKTTAGRVLSVYGKNTAYASTDDLYNADERGTLIGEISYDGEESVGEISIDGYYQYVAVRPRSNAQYFDSVSFSWGEYESAWAHLFGLR